MRKDLTTRLLFSDFDTGNYRDDVAEFRKALRDEFEELFDLNYPEPLDFAHLTLDRGMMFGYFLEENPRHGKIACPVHIKDLSAELQRDYRTFLKTNLIEGGYQDSVDDFDDNGTGISNYKLSCLEEFQEELDYFPESELVQQQRKLLYRRNMVESLKELRQAFLDVTEAWNFYDLDRMTGKDANDYPFEHSFDEVASSVMDWVENRLNDIKEETENARKK